MQACCPLDGKTILKCLADTCSAWLQTDNTSYTLVFIVVIWQHKKKTKKTCKLQENLQILAECQSWM